MAAMEPVIDVRRSQLLISSAMAVYSAAVQLGVALGTVTFVAVTGWERLLGAAPALMLGGAGLAAGPAGRAMDRVGRMPVVATGFVAGAVGAAIVALAIHLDSPGLVVLGLLAVGCANGTIQLLRTAGGDLVPASRRARGIALVLFGSVVGALLGPFVYEPVFGSHHHGTGGLVLPWLLSAGIMLLGIPLCIAVRPDPRTVAELLAGAQPDDLPAEPAPLREILRRPGVLVAMGGALTSFAVMVAVMNLTGYVVVSVHGHAQSAAFPIISAHIFGMYALVLVVGNIADKAGRRTTLVGGLLVMAVSCATLLEVKSVPATAVSLFFLGLGWNLSFVSASAQLLDLAAPAERGRLVGFNDQLASLLGASLALLYGFVLSESGLVAFALAATVTVLLPIVFVVRAGGRATPSALASEPA
jgi:MFS family permease